MEQQFSVSWREFQGNLTNGCAHLLTSGEFADVTLATEGQLLKAHRLVLSICSPFFQRMFHANPCQHPIVVLKDISYNAMKDLLQFMYNGEVSVRQEDLNNLISTAETLEIKGLTNKLNNQENNNDISNNHVPKTGNYVYNNANDKERIVDKVPYPNEDEQIELLNQMKLASFKRKCLLTKNHDSDLIVPEKRTKFREKQILNRHKIINSHKHLLPVKIPNDVIRNEALNDPIESNNYLKDNIVTNNLTFFNESANASNLHDGKLNGTLDLDVKTERDDPEPDSALEESIKNAELPNDTNETAENLSMSPKINPVSDGGVNITNPESAPWPGSPQSSKRLLPYSKHKIVTIPQKEDGKKKYPQKSCRYCWRAGRRRDTRFMCEQCHLPLCKLVCFERHLNDDYHDENDTSKDNKFWLT